MQIMGDLLTLGRQVLASQPFSVLLEAELVDFSQGRAELSLALSDRLKQQHGFVHGGVISYAADSALTFAGGSVLGTAVLSAEFKINYLAPAKGDRLIARATVVHAGKMQAVCRCDVLVADAGGERLCATAQGTIVRSGQLAAA